MPDPRPICLIPLRNGERKILSMAYPWSFAPQPSTLPELVLTKLLRPPVAIWETLTPLNDGTSNRASLYPMRRSLKASTCSLAATEGGGPREEGIVAYGPDRGTSSTVIRERSAAPDKLEGVGISTLCSPSCPCEFAFLFMGCAYVRPSEVSAKRWLVPAAIETKLKRCNELAETYHYDETNVSRQFSFSFGKISTKSMFCSRPNQLDTHPGVGEAVCCLANICRCSFAAKT